MSDHYDANGTIVEHFDVTNTPSRPRELYTPTGHLPKIGRYPDVLAWSAGLISIPFALLYYGGRRVKQGKAFDFALGLGELRHPTVRDKMKAGFYLMSAGYYFHQEEHKQAQLEDFFSRHLDMFQRLNYYQDRVASALERSSASAEHFASAAERFASAAERFASAAELAAASAAELAAAAASKKN